MNNGQFQSEVLERLRNLESDVSFIKGKLEGRSEKSSNRYNTIAIIISVGALMAAFGRLLFG